MYLTFRDFFLIHLKINGAIRNPFNPLRYLKHEITTQTASITPSTKDVSKHKSGINPNMIAHQHVISYISSKLKSKPTCKIYRLGEQRLAQTVLHYGRKRALQHRDKRPPPPPPPPQVCCGGAPTPCGGNY